ncbi:MAG: HIT domain-containing protein [Acidobacteria bacterium]|nr:HIT domain-containing protein [Acidobacteriota bacterium]
METLSTPWRYRWVTSQSKPGGCLFCRVQAARRDGPANLLLHRGKQNFIILNRFPYNNGHLMIVPNKHMASLSVMSVGQMGEMMELARRSEKAIRDLYHPDGFNLGINLGKCSGAGIIGHIHLHIVPRWAGDTNFMAVMNGTRILPESLATTYRKIRRKLRQASSGEKTQK